MKLHMRFDKSNPEHTHTTFFIDGKNVGQLCLGTEDAVALHMILCNGLCMPDDAFVSSGRVWSENGDPPMPGSGE